MKINGLFTSGLECPDTPICFQTYLFIFTNCTLIPVQENTQAFTPPETMLNRDSLVFENPSHDYPKKIIYYKIDDTKVKVSIYGNAKHADNVILLKKVNEWNW